MVLILWGFVGAWYQTNGLLNHAPLLNLQLQYRYLLDSQSTQPELIQSDHFLATELNRAPVTYGNVNQWFQLTVTNTADVAGHFNLLLDNPMSDRIRVFQKTGYDHFALLAELGDRVGSVPRALRILPNIEFKLPALSEVEFWVNVQTTGAPYLPLAIIEHSEFHEYQKTLHLIWGTFIGIILLMSAYNMVLYFGVGDRAYFVYICYICTMLLLLGVVHGYGYYIFPETLQRWLSAKIIAINAIAAYFTLQFALYFLRFQPKDGAIFSITRYVSLALLAFTLFALVAPEYIAATLFAAIQVLTYVVTGALIFNKLKTKFRWTKYYLISWIPFFIGAAIGYLLYSAHLEYTFLNRHALMFSVIFEMAFISMALADRLGDTERRRLFQATHDFKLGLANEALLESAIQRHGTHTNRHGLSLITIEISNYDAVIPYVPDSELKGLMLKLGSEFATQLKRTLPLLDIDPDHKKHANVALMRGEMFSYLVNTNKRLLLENTLKNLSNKDNFNPMQEIIPYRIQCIFGAAILNDYSEQPMELIIKAKQSVNQASESGAPYYVFNSDNTENSDRKVRLAQDLGNAIRGDSLELYHQPQFYIHDTTTASSEVLLRWTHPDLGPIPASEFVLIAEETGLIKRLTRWVLNQAFAQSKLLIDSGQSAINVSINISANDLSRLGFVDEIEVLLAKHSMQADCFTLELTETSHLTDRRTFAENFRTLRDMGFRFAIDDFGTGYSSLTYANDHPFTDLKIDRSFIQELLQSNRQIAIVSATISMAKELGLIITAEGVEDESTLQALIRLGCDKIQGYQIARPMPFKDYLNWQYEPEKTSTNIGENLPLPFEEQDEL